MIGLLLIPWLSSPEIIWKRWAFFETQCIYVSWVQIPLVTLKKILFFFQRFKLIRVHVLEPMKLSVLLQCCTSNDCAEAWHAFSTTAECVVTTVSIQYVGIKWKRYEAATYKTVSYLVHVILHFTNILHKTVDSWVIQGRQVWNSMYCLYPAHRPRRVCIISFYNCLYSVI